MSLITTFKRYLNTSRDNDSTILLGPFQCFTILLEKKFFLIPNLNLSWLNLSPLPLVLSIVMLEKKLTSLQVVVKSFVFPGLIHKGSHQSMTILIFSPTTNCIREEKQTQTMQWEGKANTGVLHAATYQCSWHLLLAFFYLDGVDSGCLFKRLQQTPGTHEVSAWPHFVSRL